MSLVSIINSSGNTYINVFIYIYIYYVMDAVVCILYIVCLKNDDEIY